MSYSQRNMKYTDHKNSLCISIFVFDDNLIYDCWTADGMSYVQSAPKSAWWYLATDDTKIDKTLCVSYGICHPIKTTIFILIKVLSSVFWRPDFNFRICTICAKSLLCLHEQLVCNPFQFMMKYIGTRGSN